MAHEKCYKKQIWIRKIQIIGKLFRIYIQRTEEVMFEQRVEGGERVRWIAGWKEFHAEMTEQIYI